jgi:ParB family chromosome partitioning protein
LLSAQHGEERLLAAVERGVIKADLAQTRLSFVVNALRRVFEEEEFLTLLRAEAMHTLPRPLAEQLELSEA